MSFFPRKSGSSYFFSSQKSRSCSSSSQAFLLIGSAKKRWTSVLVGPSTSKSGPPLTLRSAISLFLLAAYYTFLKDAPLMAVVALLFYVGCYQSLLGAGPLFAVFGVIAILSLLFIYFIVPETKGLSLEEIEAKIL